MLVPRHTYPPPPLSYHKPALQLKGVVLQRRRAAGSQWRRAGCRAFGLKVLAQRLAQLRHDLETIVTAASALTEPHHRRGRHDDGRRTLRPHLGILGVRHDILVLGGVKVQGIELLILVAAQRRVRRRASRERDDAKAAGNKAPQARERPTRPPVQLNAVGLLVPRGRAVGAVPVVPFCGDGAVVAVCEYVRVWAHAQVPATSSFTLAMPCGTYPCSGTGGCGQCNPCM